MTGYSFVGRKEDVLFSKKLTIKNIIDANDIISEANKIAMEQSHIYSKVGKPKIEDNSVKVIGTKEYKGLMDGTGGAFDYYELGQPIFKKDKNLNEEVGESKIREYIYYTETKQYLDRPQGESCKYLLNTYNDTGYYFYYEKDRLTTLSIDTLSIVTEKAEQYIIYADKCMLDKEYMQEKSIVFKKIPRDIKRF